MKTELSLETWAQRWSVAYAYHVWQTKSVAAEKKRLLDCSPMARFDEACEII